MTKATQVNSWADFFNSKKRHLSLSTNENSMSSATRERSFKSSFVFILVFMILQAGSILFAQNLQIRGKVVSEEDGTVLIGANILEKGTYNGTSTNLDGEFKLKVKPGAVLVISYVGYLKKEIRVTESSFLNVSLKLDLTKVDEVVVVGIGYGEVKKADATGSVTAISAKDFNKGNITSPQELLIGKAAGVIANSLGGAAGAGTKIRIRGGSSIIGNNDPLIVVDDIPYDNTGISGMANPLSTINPNDIESFVILKDASATAIYGSRASNGVIIIKTKRGKLIPGGKGKLSVSYTGNVSISSVTDKLSVLSGDEFRKLIKDRIKNHGLTKSADSLLGSANTNWQDQIYRDAASTEHNLSFNHSLGKVPYRVSFGYLNQSGILKENNLERKNFGLALTPSLFNNTLTMDLSANVSLIDNNFSNSDAIGAAVEFDPTQPIRNGNKRFGGLTAWTEKKGNKEALPNNIATHNPVAQLKYRDNTSEAKRYVLGGKFDYKIPYINGLKATLNLGYDYYKTEGKDIMSKLASWSYREPENQIKGYEQEKKNSLLDFYLNYKKDMGMHKFDLTGGYSYQHFQNEGLNSKRAWDPKVPGADTTSYKNEYYLISFFGRMNYTLNDKYLVTFTLRNDGSSRFAKHNRWGLFPAVALGWKITEESFIGKSDVVNDLKLRLSWGQTGQQDVGNNYYPYIPTYTGSTQGAYYQFGNKFYPTLRPDAYDANLKWETVTSMNLGLDYSLFNNRVSGSIEVYKNETKDLLNNVPIAVGSNFSNYLLTNVGNMENKGVEISLNIKPVVSRDFTWNIGLNFTHNKNEITKLTLIDSPDYTGVNTGGISGAVGNTIQKYLVGMPARIFFLFKQVYDINGKPIEGAYVDKIGKSGNISGNELNKYYLKTPDPKFLVGISSKINYKDFDFSFSGRLSIDNYVYNNNKSNRALYHRIYDQSGFLSNILSAVRETNFTKEQFWSSVYLENASFFKLDYVSVGYNFSSVFGNAVNGRIGFSVQNVFTITDYSGLDPEVDNGIDNNIYPRPRTYKLSLSLNY